LQLIYRQEPSLSSTRLDRDLLGSVKHPGQKAYDGSKAMPVTVRLEDIVEALEMQFESASSFLDCETGQVETVTHELLSEAERGTEPSLLPDWQKPEWETAKQIASGGRFVSLPSQFDIHEWSIMEDFAASVKSDRIRGELLDAIHGAGAFRNFKSAIRRRRIEKDWFAFRLEALKEIAIEWCEEHEIAWQQGGEGKAGA